MDATLLFVTFVSGTLSYMRHLAFITIFIILTFSSCQNGQNGNSLEREAYKLQLRLDRETTLSPKSDTRNYFDKMSTLIPDTKETYLLYLLDASCSSCIANYLFFQTNFITDG